MVPPAAEYRGTPPEGSACAWGGPALRLSRPLLQLNCAMLSL